jgi:hypothetical protein
LLTAWEKEHIRAALLAALTLTGTPADAARAVDVDLLNYAQVLAAYWCYTDTLLPKETPNDWAHVLAVYHAGGSCIQPGGGLCPAGLSYIERLTDD